MTMTPEELEILEALEGVANRLEQLHDTSQALSPEEKNSVIAALYFEGFVRVKVEAAIIELTRAGHEVLALRRRLAEVEKDLDIAQSGKVFYHGEWDRKTTQLRECATERDQLRAALEATP